MRVDPTNLVNRLNKSCTRMLESVVGRVSTRNGYEITPDHMLELLVEEELTDVELILDHFGVDRQRLLLEIRGAIQGMRTGNSGRPTFSENLFQWFEDAWLVGSIQHDSREVRSGHLLLAFAARGHRYSSERYDSLRAIRADELRRNLPTITEGSPEQVAQEADAQASPAPDAATGPGTHQGDGALARFTTSFTDRAQAGEIDPIFGRDREVQQMTEILVRRRKNNPIIVGEPGVGKTALVEGLAHAIASGEVPEALREVDLRMLDLGLLQAGASVRGEFEKRLKGVIDEVKSSPRPIVLFIDEAHTLINPKDGSDAANLLKPALARGELRTIAATTWSEFKKYFEKDAALERRFQPVQVDQPSEENALVMMRGLREIYEKAHGVMIRDEALAACVALSHRYISGRQLPDKAVDLLDTAAARVRLEQQSKPFELGKCEQDVLALDRELTGLERERASGYAVDQGAIEKLQARRRQLDDRRESIEARWGQEREALATLRVARDALRGANESNASDSERGRLEQAVNTAAEALATAQGSEPLLHPDVDADVVARVVSSWTSIPVGKMQSGTLELLLELEARLTSRVCGQPEAIRVVAETLRVARAGIQNPDAPLGVLLFVGPSGVGKTETALALADMLYGGERFLTTINMSEFQEKHTVSRLIGSPPGYVGFGEGGKLTEAVRQKPYSVVLLDEVEKADLDVMNLFYQVFDKGTLCDGEGREINFRNTVIILTSNLASDLVMEHGSGSERSTQAVREAIRPVLSRHFKPALLARMTVVPYLALDADTIRTVTEGKLARLAQRVEENQGVSVGFGDGLVEHITARCTDSESGARNVDHILRESLMPAISRHLLQRLAANIPTRELTISYDAEIGWSFAFDGDQAT